MAGPPVALTVDPAPARGAFLGQLDRIVRVADGLDDHALLAASRCHGWAVVDVVVHVRTGLEEMLRGATAPTDDPPTVDAATYWSTWTPEQDAVDGILWTRRTAAAYRRPTLAVRHLRAAADAISAAALPEGALRFQGHVLTVGDFLATWAVELAVHHADLGRDLDVGRPTEAALRLTRATVEALLGGPVTPGVDDLDVLLAGAGRTSAGPTGIRAVLG